MRTRRKVGEVGKRFKKETRAACKFGWRCEVDLDLVDRHDDARGGSRTHAMPVVTARLGNEGDLEAPATVARMSNALKKHPSGVSITFNAIGCNET
jgi:hypothetical protein